MSQSNHKRTDAGPAFRPVVVGTRAGRPTAAAILGPTVFTVSAASGARGGKRLGRQLRRGAGCAESDRCEKQGEWGVSAPDRRFLSGQVSSGLDTSKCASGARVQAARVRAPASSAAVPRRRLAFGLGVHARRSLWATVAARAGWPNRHPTPSRPPPGGCRPGPGSPPGCLAAARASAVGSRTGPWT